MVAKTLLLLALCLHTSLARLFEDSDTKALLEEILEKLNEKESRISKLENLVQQQQNRIVNLETEVAAQKQQIIALEKENDSVKETQEASDKEDETNFADEATALRTERSKQKRIQPGVVDPPVAFFATLSGISEHMGKLQNIHFDNVLTNVGGAYNPHAGIFVAPVPGIYVFSTTIFSHHATDGHFAFLRNGSVLTNLYLSPGSTNYDSTSMSLVLQLGKGDDVSVANNDADRTINGYHYTCFSGFLLQELSEDSTALIGK